MIKPSVDLGYPTEAQGDLPAFQSIEEEAAFWDTHSVTDLSEITDTDMDEESADSEQATPLVVSLNPTDRLELDRLAKIEGVGPSTLARIWLAERLHQNEKTG